MLGGKTDEWTLGFVSRLLCDYLGRGDHPSVARHSGPVLVKEGSPEGQGLICPVSFQAVLLNALPDAVEYALNLSPSLHSIQSFLKWLPEKPLCRQHRRDVLRQNGGRHVLFQSPSPVPASLSLRLLSRPFLCLQRAQEAASLVPTTTKVRTSSCWAGSASGLVFLPCLQFVLLAAVNTIFLDFSRMCEKESQAP